MWEASVEDIHSDILRTIDLRSDTVTLPTDEMRRTMIAAPVGDDGYDEDPTVHRLQLQVAELFGKEAALFMPSGVMSNQAALMAHTTLGDTILVGANHHIATTERESTTRIAGLQIKSLGKYGIFSHDEVEEAYFRHSDAASPIRLISIENTVNFGGGSIFPLVDIEKISMFARRHQIPLHLDGARLLNAVVATGIPAIVWTSFVDTVCVCLSKGLGAPIGSVIAGPVHVITKIRRIRKMLGGAMRQVGMLAAAGSYALSHHVQRLEEDHQNAKVLAQGLKALGFIVDPWPQTNIVNFSSPMFSSQEWASWFLDIGIQMNVVPTGQLRAVTHLGIQLPHIQQAIGRISRLVQGKQQG